ncbi:GNAT family N-acetyltransferase [Gorillibacterium massiliense]|uniref:GNAT family N-acetyltransferase n=1 Tax=Gorillibacterium massiliense TaxID=1280390 RepID=UPI0004B0055F|nr:GNAT family N-acetyltransferase [Gorillibacterium massiliense]
MKRVYKKLSLSDLHLVLRMEQDFRSGFICVDNARQFLSNPSNWLFACIEDERIIGFAYGYELNRLNDIGNMLYIHEVGVLPEYQRQGIGREMLTRMKELCTLSGICRFFLFSQKSNTAACALYESVGGEASHEDDVAFFFQTK